MFLFSIFYGQNISGYKYIYIPKDFADAKINKYGLNNVLAAKLKQKKYVILNDVIEADCESLKVEIKDTSNFLTNKIQISFKDCHHKTIASFEGKSSIKEIEVGMRDAMEIVANKISVSNPVQKENITQNSELAQTKSSTKAEIFSNGILTLNKINISENQFILTNPNNSVPYAIFQSSAKKDVYRVKLENGTQTLGYLEEGKIIVEIANSDGSLKKEIFERK